jgi:hypothetical protein
MIEDTTKRDALGKLVGAMNIEGMEAAGGQQFASEPELMPADGPWDELVELGFAPPEPTDDPLFVRTRLPDGWSKRLLDDPRGGEILDERGLPRVGTFYKAAFYDRKADCHLIAPGWHAATHGIYGDDPVGQPHGWDVMTSEEREEYVRGLRGYLADAKEHPNIYGERVPRVKALLDAVS